MQSIIRMGFSLLFLLPLISPGLLSANDCKELTLQVFGPHNGAEVENLRKPEFKWNDIPGAETYQVVIQGSIVATTKEMEYIPRDELAYGTYVAEIKVIFKSGEPCLSPAVRFPVGLTIPLLVSPTPENAAKDPWNVKPTFEFYGSRGAQKYLIILNGEKIGEVPADREKDRIRQQMLATEEDSNPEALYSWQLPDKAKSLDPGAKYVWRVVSSNEAQNVQSDRQG